MFLAQVIRLFTMTTSKPRQDWNVLGEDEQILLLEQYNIYLDELPPTCSMDVKLERFTRWLEERGVIYEHAT